MLKDSITITQVTSDLVKLKNNRVKCQTHQKINHSYTEAMTFLRHANQEEDFIRRTKIVMSLPKDLHPLAKDMPIPSE